MLILNLWHIFKCYSFFFVSYFGMLSVFVLLWHISNPKFDLWLLVSCFKDYIYIYVFFFLVCFICIGVRIVSNVWSGFCCLSLVVHIGAQSVVPLVAKESTQRLQRWDTDAPQRALKECTSYYHSDDTHETHPIDIYDSSFEISWGTE